MKAILFLPVIIENFLRCLILPKWIFVATYSVSSEELRMSEEQLRNAIRLADYKAKQFLQK